MDQETQEKALAALEREKARYKRQNAWTAANYERQSITLPIGTKDRIKAAGETSMNAYINKLILDDLARRGV